MSSPMSGLMWFLFGGSVMANIGLTVVVAGMVVRAQDENAEQQ